MARDVDGVIKKKISYGTKICYTKSNDVYEQAEEAVQVELTA